MVLNVPDYELCCIVFYEAFEVTIIVIYFLGDLCHVLDSREEIHTL